MPGIRIRRRRRGPRATGVASSASRCGHGAQFRACPRATWIRPEAQGLIAGGAASREHPRSPVSHPLRHREARCIITLARSPAQARRLLPPSLPPELDSRRPEAPRVVHDHCIRLAKRDRPEGARAGEQIKRMMSKYTAPVPSSIKYSARTTADDRRPTPASARPRRRLMRANQLRGHIPMCTHVSRSRSLPRPLGPPSIPTLFPSAGVSVCQGVGRRVVVCSNPRPRSLPSIGSGPNSKLCDLGRQQLAGDTHESRRLGPLARCGCRWESCLAPHLVTGRHSAYVSTDLRRLAADDVRTEYTGVRRMSMHSTDRIRRT
ncbi:hypothetical protein C8Q80DRAFT_450719 [Daedaleopsis nitida]|nr:hypothetical protein C8Q80DRAFT_450719 [Daedaleopsis nitida]